MATSGNSVNYFSKFLAPGQMKSLLRLVRTFRKRMLYSTSGITYVDEWWAEARECRSLLGNSLPKVPPRPEEYGNRDYVQARVDQLETWLEESIAALEPAIESLTTPPALADKKPTFERVPLVLAAIEAAKTPRDGRGKNIDAKMLKIMAEFSGSHRWTIRKWAAHLGCVPSTVGESKTWKERLSTLKIQNAIDSTEKMDKSRTNPKGKRKPKHVSDD